MIELNLLPVSSKRQIRKDINQIDLINNIIVMTMVWVIITLLLMAAQEYLSYKTTQINQVGLVTAEESKAKKINNVIKEVEVVQRDYIKWSRVIQNFLSLIPEGNRINNLILDKTNQKLFIEGVANTRQDFLNLEKNMKESDLLSDLKSPISNLLYQRDIKFTLEANLNL